MLFLDSLSKKVLLSLCLFILSTGLSAQDTLTVYVDNTGYSIDSLDANLYYVPVRVRNLTDIVGLDITIETGAGATMVAVADTLLPTAGTTVSLPNDTTLRVLYIDFTGGSLSYEDDEAIFVMAVHFEGMPGDCFPFNITAFEAVHIDDPGATVPFNAIAEEICLPTIVALSGVVATPNGIPLDSVLIQIIQSDTLYSTLTDTLGRYSFESVPVLDTAIISPVFKLNEDTRIERISGINIIDFIVMSRHILGTELITSPYTLIAADVNNSHSISTADLIALRSYVLYRTDSYPNNPFYRFLDAGFVFPNMANPWETDFPESVIINPVSNRTDINFVGIKIGNVRE